jgi:hypothetical protein
MPKVYRSVTHVTETITPDKAQAYLEKNQLNRKVRPARVKELKEMMTAGWWVENGEAGITFDWNDVLAGGQHTLKAVVDSGVTIKCRVTRGVDPAARTTMNDSRKQSMADDLSVAGVTDAARSEALLRKIAVWERAAAGDPRGQGGLMSWKRVGFGRGYLAAQWPRHAEEITGVLFDIRKWQGSWNTFGGNLGALSFMYWLITEHYGYPAESAGAFFDLITFGSAEEEDRVFVSLRRRMSIDREAARQVYWMCKTWNMYHKGNAGSRLQLPKGSVIADPFPVLRKPR